MKQQHVFKQSLLLILFIIGGYSCTTDIKEADSNKVTPQPDGLFMFKNIKSSLFVADSVTISKYIQMDTVQKMQYLSPKIVIDNPDIEQIGQSYINQYMYAYFISQQDNIGDFKPIIVGVHGDDYGALILLLLDKKNKPISHLLLSGGLCGGPDGEIGDSIILLHDRESIIKHDEVITYILRIRQPENKDNALPVIDSISYLNKILPDGTIKTIKTDSTRYARKFEDPQHSW